MVVPRDSEQQGIKWLTRREVAMLLQISDTTVWRWVRDGYLKPIKLGNVERFRADEVDSIRERIAEMLAKETDVQG